VPPSEDGLPLALAGAGWMAAVHAMAAALVEGAYVATVASRDPERAAALAAGAGATSCRFEDLPKGARAVVVATPPALHAAHALAAVEAGVAALVEKPLCTTLADADRLVAAAKAGAHLAYGENLVHAPVVASALAHAAQLDGIDVLEVRALQPRPTWGDFLTEGWGGGVLFDLGPHPLALALLLAAPARPVEVQATLAGASDHPVDEHAEVGLRFDSGALARVVASWRGQGAPVWDAQASSPDGVVRLELLPRPLLERNGVEVRLPPPPPDVPAPLVELGYLDQLRTFAAEVADGRPASVGVAFGRSVLDVICAAYASAGAGGAWVPLPFEGPRTRTPLQLWRR
jgi:myo-inositol 2-dehydrogenase/D-chiro-inositol 1-dehydrogenase